MLRALCFLRALAGAAGAPTLGTATAAASFAVPKAPSGMFYFPEQQLLYVLCGTSTNGDHYVYAYGTDGAEKCLITIPAAAGMSRVDGFQIEGSTAYIADSQGPIYASQGKLGKSVYAVEWTNPCGCDAAGACASKSASWSPRVTGSFAIDGAAVGDGGGKDGYFRNSGMVAKGGAVFAVNGMHPVSESMSAAYPKSLLKLNAGDGAVLQRWAFDGTTLGRQVDMEALACGADGCSTHIYIGDEYNFVYKLNLATADPAASVEVEWDLNAIVGDVAVDKGIESMSYNEGVFYVGIQGTAKVHAVRLADTAKAPSCGAKVAGSAATCTAADASSQRVRKELRSLSSAEWQKVVDAIWTLKNTSMAAGKSRFGDSFRSYDYFVVKHAVATVDSRGDQAHFAAAFATWHGAFVLEFERALLAVDPSIGALPYWDGTWSVTTADFFGSAPGSGANSVVADGKFANFPVLASFDVADWSSYLQTVAGASNTFAGSGGYLRSSGSSLRTAHVTRYGSSWTFEAACQTECMATAGCWFDWFSCIQGGSPGGNFHGGAHSGIGGSSGTNLGDFEDPVTSPNDPIFWFHHANTDRNARGWMYAHRNEASVFFGYGGECVRTCPSSGVALEDVAGALFPFSSADLGFPGSSAALTHADILCHLQPAKSPYAYGPSQAEGGKTACAAGSTGGGGGGPSTGGRPSTGGDAGGDIPKCSATKIDRCCGDGTCGGPETASNCAEDCGSGSPAASPTPAPPGPAPPSTSAQPNVTSACSSKALFLLAAPLLHLLHLL